MPPRTFRHTLRSIERAFADLERSLQRLAKQTRRAARDAGRQAKPGASRGKLRITPQRRAKLKPQGRYMTFMRQLGPRQKARVRAVKEKRGFEAAIRLARRITNG